MKRKEMDPKYQWDFTHIYPDKAAWEAAMAEAEAAVAGLAALPGTLKVSKDGFKKGLDAAYAAMEKVELPFIYANLHKWQRAGAPEYGRPGHDPVGQGHVHASLYEPGDFVHPRERPRRLDG